MLTILIKRSVFIFVPTLFFILSSLNLSAQTKPKFGFPAYDRGPQSQGPANYSNPSSGSGVFEQNFRPYSKAERILDRGILRLQRGDILGAMLSLDKAIEMDSSLLDAYGIRGVLRIELQNFKGAIADFDKVIKLGGGAKDPAALKNRAEAKVGEYMLLEAIEDLEEAKKLYQKVNAYEEVENIQKIIDKIWLQFI